MSVESSVGERELSLLVQVADSGKVKRGLTSVVGGIDTGTKCY